MPSRRLSARVAMRAACTHRSLARGLLTAALVLTAVAACGDGNDGSTPPQETGGATTTGGRSGGEMTGGGGGEGGRGGRTGGDGGAVSAGGAGGRSSGGAGGRSAGGAGGRSAGGAGGRSSGGAGGSSSSCPYTGHVTYTLAKAAAPTAAEQSAYEKITTAMDKALAYYNCYTPFTKAEMVTYVPSVQTADGNTNGSIRFGSTDSMNYITAMHEIAHTVGVGSSGFNALIVNGIFTGTHATNQLREITGVATDEVHGDTQHFWPYGLNYTSEVKSEADLLAHCKMVIAIRKDMGL